MAFDTLSMTYLTLLLKSWEIACVKIFSGSNLVFIYFVCMQYGYVQDNFLNPMRTSQMVQIRFNVVNKQKSWKPQSWLIFQDYDSSAYRHMLAWVIKLFMLSNYFRFIRRGQRKHCQITDVIVWDRHSCLISPWEDKSRMLLLESWGSSSMGKEVIYKFMMIASPVKCPAHKSAHSLHRDCGPLDVEQSPETGCVENGVHLAGFDSSSDKMHLRRLWSDHLWLWHYPTIANGS